MTWKTNAWKSPRAKHESGEEWCLQCGTDGKPERAIGVDEDGEPACGLHRVKELGAGLNAAGDKGLVPFPRTPVPAPLVSKQAAERPAPDPRYGVTKAVSSAADQQPAAAPSPVQTSAKEQEMERATPKYNDKPCGDCGKMYTPTGARSTFCIDCAAERLKARDKTKRQNSGAKHKKAKAKKVRPPAMFGGATASDPFEAWSDEEVIAYRDHGVMPERVRQRAEIPAPLQLEAVAPLMPGMNERVIHFYLGESKVQKLLNLLLAD